MFKRIITIVLDGVGVGAAADAASYGDTGANTLAHVDQQVGGLVLPQLQQMGLGNILPLNKVAATDGPAIFGRMSPQGIGKDTTSGHWEIAGLINDRIFPTFPDGFPPEIMAELSAAIGRGFLGNYPASGTDIIRDLGAEHLATGKPIIYTSADSVLQLAAHTSVLSVEEQYRLCKAIRPIADRHEICRVIARPFSGNLGAFARVSGRKDFSMSPYRQTILNRLQGSDREVVAVGKINDIFCGSGIDRAIPTSSNREGMETTIRLIKEETAGFVFTNLVDFDTKYGHRLDCEGFARALVNFDTALQQLKNRMKPDDLLMITADHGCDPLCSGTDHTREQVPLLIWHQGLDNHIDLGIRDTFADIAATIADNFQLDGLAGASFLHSLSALR